MFDINMLFQKEVLIIILPIIALVIIMFVGQVVTNQKSLSTREQKVKKTLLGNLGQGSQIKKELLEKLNDGVDIDKRYQTETKLIQAGLSWTYAELKIYCIMCGIITPISIFVLLDNIYLAVMLGLVGAFLPKFFVNAKANKRVSLIEDQVGAFLRLIIERYKNSRDMSSCLQKCLSDFKGQEPFYSILKQANIELSMSIPCGTVLKNMARATGNEYMSRFADFYKMSENLASHELKVEMLSRPFAQYAADREIKLELKEQINGPVSEASIMLVMTPVFMIWQCFTTEGYLDFMLHTEMGKIGMAAIVCILLLCAIFTKVKIGGPIDS